MFNLIYYFYLFYCFIINVIYYNLKIWYIDIHINNFPIKYMI